MATKRGEKSKHELVTLAKSRKEDEFIERLVLPTDTIQGIALLYNTSVSLTLTMKSCLMNCVNY